MTACHCLEVQVGFERHAGVTDLTQHITNEDRLALSHRHRSLPQMRQQHTVCVAVQYEMVSVTIRRIRACRRAIFPGMSERTS